jgi:2-succinyl-5-enolpyruvyl-6-hydroxy-3-cyclohexene-1-carboxylate synthase
MNRLQPIYDIAELCSKKGITQAIVCPGSRCAPLTLALSRHPTITTKTITDERSAAFIALGIAQQTQQPTVLVCTSGSAAYNFAPAIAEAFFQEIPLLILTADRPTEWIDQWDGQTIQQSNLFGAHVKKSFNLPQEYTHADATWHINRLVNEAINLSKEYPNGPVHINVPLREPLYPSPGEKIMYSPTVRVIEEATNFPTLPEADQEALLNSLQKFTRILIIAGQQEYNDGLVKSVARFSKKLHAVIVGDVISNFHSAENTIRLADSILGQCTASVKKSLQPELVITFGKSVISKNVKLFLRESAPKEHWHIQPTGIARDPFQSLTKVIRTTSGNFFESLQEPNTESTFDAQKKENYIRLWQAEEHRIQLSHQLYFKETSFSEINLLKEVMQSLPLRCNLHLSNSMAVRYANMIGLQANQKGVHVFANRGTSGIDGCTSTAVGNSFTSDIPTILVTGDLAFFYDRNAFWHNYKMPNFHIILVNNQGGAIFGMIDGPGNLPESEEYFVTRQKLTAKNLAEEFNFEYIALDSPKKIKNSLKDIFDFLGTTKILEIKSDVHSAKEAFTHFNSQIKKGYDA